MGRGAALAPDLETAIREVRRQVEEMRPLLEDASATGLNRCGAALEAATARLRALRSDLTRLCQEPPVRKRALAREAASLRNSIRGVTLLLDSAARYHAGWNGLLGAMSAGYVASGAPAATGRRGRLNVEG